MRGFGIDPSKASHSGGGGVKGGGGGGGGGGDVTESRSRETPKVKKGPLEDKARRGRGAEACEWWSAESGGWWGQAAWNCCFSSCISNAVTGVYGQVRRRFAKTANLVFKYIYAYIINELI